MRHLLALPLALVLAGCPPPQFSALYREPPPPRSMFLNGTDCPPADSVRSSYFGVACLPDEFNRRAAGAERVEVQTFGGRTVRGRRVEVRDDTVFVESRAVPLASAESVRLYDGRSARDRAVAVAASTAVTAGILGGLGLIGDTAGGGGEDGLRQGLRHGLGIGAGVGLSLGVLLATGDAPGERFEVHGWADRPHPANVLVPEDDRTLRPGPPDEGACGAPLPPEAPPYFDAFVRCVTPAELRARAGAGWVEAIDLHLADGGLVRADSLAFRGGQVLVGGRALPLADVARIDLRHPRPPLQPLWTTARGAAWGAGLGALAGLGIWAGTGDPDAVWQAAAITGSVGAAGGALVGLARRDEARDVTYLPPGVWEPAPPARR